MYERTASDAPSLDKRLEHDLDIFCRVWQTNYHAAVHTCFFGVLRLRDSEHIPEYRRGSGQHPPMYFELFSFRFKNDVAILKPYF